MTIPISPPSNLISVAASGGTSPNPALLNMTPSACPIDAKNAKTKPLGSPFTFIFELPPFAITSIIAKITINIPNILLLLNLSANKILPKIAAKTGDMENINKVN